LIIWRLGKKERQRLSAMRALKRKEILDKKLRFNLGILDYRKAALILVQVLSINLLVKINYNRLIKFRTEMMGMTATMICQSQIITM
jgi:hypothetical protein